MIVLVRSRLATAALLVAALLPGCSTAGGDGGTASPDTAEPTTTVSSVDAGNAAPGQSSFVAEVWVDNWFSLYVNGTKVGEDSVPITTERSFNSETVRFTATYPLTIAMVTKDFKEDDSGLEYIGTDRQQVGDGGFIAQITDTTTGKVVAHTDGDWKGLVIHRAPLDPMCEQSASPKSDCRSSITAEPADWTSPGFEDAGWVNATTYSEGDVGVKDGYNDVRWDPSARLIWTSSLTQDNTILWRVTVRP